MTRHPWLSRTVILDGDTYTLARVDGPYAHLSTATTLRAIDMRTTALSLAPTEAPPAAPTAPALSTGPAPPPPFSVTVATRLGAAESIHLPATELAAAHLGRPPEDYEVRVMLAQTGTTRKAPTATLETPGGPLTILRTYKGNRVWLDISRKK